MPELKPRPNIAPVRDLACGSDLAADVLGVVGR